MSKLNDPQVIKAAQTAVAPFVERHKGVIAHAAAEFNFSAASLWQLVTKGKLLPIVARELSARGLLVVPKSRHRRAATFANQQRLDLFDQMMRSRGTTMTEWMNQELDRYERESR